MTEAPAIEREFLACAIEQSHPLIRALAGPCLSDNLSSIVRRDVSRIDDPEFAGWYAKGWQSLGIPAARFNNRLIDLGSLRIIAGIRFRNLDPDFPFVGIEQSTVAFGTIVDSTMIARLGAEFSEFHPRAISFTHPSHLPPTAVQARNDRHLFVARASSMIAGAAPPGVDRVRLATTSSDAIYDRYVALYDVIFRERPWLNGVLRVETRETVRRCGAQGLLFAIEVDGVWSGVIMGCADRAAGVDGIEVVDIIMSRQARGQALGIAVQHRFAEKAVANDPSVVIFGTIDDANLPMRRTAERAGRVDVGGPFVIDL